MQIDRKMLHKLFLLVAGSLVFAWLLLDTARATKMFATIWDVFAPFAAGAGVAFVFNVPMRGIERQLDGIRKPGLRRVLAIVLTIAMLVLFIMFVVEMLVPQISKTVAALIERIPAFIERTSKALTALFEEHPELLTTILNTLNSVLNLEQMNLTAVLQWAVSFVTNQGTTMVGNAVSAIGILTNGVVNTVIALAFAVYCLSRKEILARQGRRILYCIAPEKVCDEIVRVLRLVNATFSNFISGQCLEACILACLFAVTMALLGMPYIPLVSVTIGVTALVPVVGAFVGCIVGAFFILVDDPIQAMTFVAMFLILQQLENNLIYPRVVGTSIGLPGMWVLVAVTVGGEIMGVAGMFLMIPMASVCYTLLHEYTDKRLAQLNIPRTKLQDQPPEIQSQFRKNKARKQRQRLEKMKEKLQKMQEQQRIKNNKN